MAAAKAEPRRFSVTSGARCIAAEIRRLQTESASVRLRNLFLNPDWSSLRQSDLDTMLRQSPPAEPSRPPVNEPETPRAGEAGDVLKALWRYPPVNFAANRILNDTSRQLRRSWNQSSTGERALLVSHTVTIGAVALTAILANRESRVGVLDFLSGIDIPVPKVDGLTIQMRHNKSGSRPDYGAVLTLDLAPYVRELQ